MQERAEYYESLSKTDVRVAFKEIMPEITASQERLRANQLDHILIKLVKTEKGKISFDKRFGQHISNWTGIKRENMGNFYSVLGHYISLLESEAEKYSKGN